MDVAVPQHERKQAAKAGFMNDAPPIRTNGGTQDGEGADAKDAQHEPPLPATPLS
jgi:hypothetical protein